MKRAFTILEATIGALMLSCLIAVFADYFVSRTTKARDSEMQTALYALTQSCNNALSNAYATAMQSRMQELVRNKGSISDFTLELPTGTMQDCYAVVRSAFRDYVYFNNGMVEVEDPFNRSSTGAKPIDGLAPILAIPEELYVNIQYIVQKPNEPAVAPDFVATKSSHNPSYAWRFEYRGASTVSFTLYHTLVVTVFTDKDGLDFRAGMPALANYIKEGVINAANVVFTLHTQCEAEGFNMEGFEPMATSGTISSPFSTNLLARFADNPLVDDEQPEVPDVPDLRFARAGFDDLSLSVSFNQGSTPDTTPSGSITLKDLDLRQDITLNEGESVEWSISGSSAVIRGNGTSADIVFSGIDYARLAAGNHDFVETVTAKIMKDGKVIRTITGKVRLGSNIIRNNRVNILSADFEIEFVRAYNEYWYNPVAYLKLTLKSAKGLSCGSKVKISGEGLFLFADTGELESQAAKVPYFNGISTSNNRRTYFFGWYNTSELWSYILTPLGEKGFISIDIGSGWPAYCFGLASQIGSIRSINGNEVLVSIDWFIATAGDLPYVFELLPPNVASYAQIDSDLNGYMMRSFKNPYSRQNRMICSNAYLEIL